MFIDQTQVYTIYSWNNNTEKLIMVSITSGRYAHISAIQYFLQHQII